MTEGTAILIALIGAVFSVIGSYLASVVLTKQANYERDLRDARWKGSISTKVDAMWQKMFRNSTMDGMDAGILETNSPIRANVLAFAGHQEFVDKLKAFYEEKGKQLDDLDLMVQIETAFADDLARFELEHHLRPGASLAAVCYLVRPEMDLFDHRLFDLKKDGE